MNPIYVKVCTKSSDYYTTRFNGSLDEAIDYFLNIVRWYITEDDLTGDETYDRIVEVTQI